jgi:hypothetical protein
LVRIHSSCCLLLMHTGIFSSFASGSLMFTEWINGPSDDVGNGFTRRARCTNETHVSSRFWCGGTSNHIQWL